MNTFNTAFIFTSSREGQEADTAFRGSNHMTGSDTFVIPAKSIKALFMMPKLLRYDFVIAQDNLMLGYFVSLFAKIFRTKTRWLYIAMNSSVLIRRYANNRIKLSLLRIFWKSYSRIICLASEQMEDFVRIGIPKEHLIFIPFGVDADFFVAGSSFLEENLIVSVGRDAGRDYPTLFKAAENLPLPFTVVAGRKNISPNAKIPVNVSVLYDKSLAEIRDLYKRAKIVTVVSKKADVPEGSDCSGQTVILDAMAAGKAVVATHRSWILDYFVPDHDLIVVEPDNPTALANAINDLFFDHEKRERIARSGHGKVTENYTTKNFAKSLEILMKSLT